jgi:hypothetical protein
MNEEQEKDMPEVPELPAEETEMKEIPSDTAETPALSEEGPEVPEGPAEEAEVKENPAEEAEAEESPAEETETEESPAETAETPALVEEEPEAPETPPAIQLTVKQKIAKLPIALKLIVLAAAALLMLLVVFAVRNKIEKDKNAGKISLDTIEFQIREVLHTTRLNTAEYMYKGVVNWFFEEENGKQTKVGFVKYTGRIKYGVDFDDIRVEADEAKNVIVITIPAMKKEPYVEDAECIFLNQVMRMRFNDSKYMNLMRQACLDHITYNAGKDDALETAAEEYTKELVESLTSPFFDADSEASFEIRMEE